jgi:hypothetical protein
VLAIVAQERRHVERSPGIGVDAHAYALACYDDLEHAIAALRPSPSATEAS